MLTTGCECPIDVKPENLRAMVETGKRYRGKRVRQPSPSAAVKEEKEPSRVECPKGKIAEALSSLKYDEVERLIEQALAGGIDPLNILEECKAGMDTVGELYSTGEYFLSELILSANMFKKALEIMKPLARRASGAEFLGSVVIGTPKGDIHDLGKNIVATLFMASGFEVADLGVDVDPRVFVDEISKRDAKIVAVSALITPLWNTGRGRIERAPDQVGRASACRIGLARSSCDMGSFLDFRP